MIDENKTRDFFGYVSNELSPRSSKKIVAICDDCGKERIQRKSAYRKLCMRCVQKFCYRTESCRENRRLRVLGENNPFFGKKHTDETKNKISQAQRKRELTLFGGQAAKNKVISRYKRGAKIRNLVFSLTNEKLDELFSGNCHYCGSLPSNVRKHGISNGEFIYSGIDRLDNNIGYIENNCVSCCMICNMAKRNLDYHIFIDWINKLYNYQDAKRNK